MWGDSHLHKSDSNFNPPIPLTCALVSLNAFLNQQSFSQLGIIILLGKEKTFSIPIQFPWNKLFAYSTASASNRIKMPLLIKLYPLKPNGLSSRGGESVKYMYNFKQYSKHTLLDKYLLNISWLKFIVIAIFLFPHTKGQDDKGSCLIRGTVVLHQLQPRSRQLHLRTCF